LVYEGPLHAACKPRLDSDPSLPQQCGRRAKVKGTRMLPAGRYPCPTPAAAAAQCRRSRPLLSPRRVSPVTRIAFQTCRAHYPGGSNGCVCRCFPARVAFPVYLADRHPRFTSRPAQASLALRPAQLLNRPRRPLSRGFDTASYAVAPLVSYQTDRLLSGWNLPPLVIRAFRGAQVKIQGVSVLARRKPLLRLSAVRL
jgi:hypothetical protein